MTKSKRYRITLIALIANFLILVFSIIMNTDLVALGTAIAMINAPLYGYIWGETNRPSGTKKKTQDEMVSTPSNTLNNEKSDA